MTHNLDAELGLDTTNYKANVTVINREMRKVTAEFRAATATMDSWSSSSEGLEQNIESLNRKIPLQEKAIENLNKEYQDMVEAGEANTVTAKNLEIRILKYNETLGKMQRELRQSKEKQENLGKEQENSRKKSIRLKDALQSVNRSLTRVGSAAAGAARGLGRMAATAAKATARIALGAAKMAAVVAGAGFVGGGVAAVNMSAEIDKATSHVQAQLGLTEEQAKEFGDVIKTVYGDNFGESIEDVGNAVATIQQQLGNVTDLTKEGLGEATESALALRDAFDVDVSESTNAVAALMKNFGLSSQEAFDFVSSGMQKGLNSSDDFLDTIREYSNLFSDSGFEASQFFSIMETGLQAGVLGTDKVADAFKEMNIRLNEGNDDVIDAFKTMGKDFEGFQDHVRSGDKTWADYFGSIVSGLEGIEDPVERAQAQVAIFGTMAEDLGLSFTSGLSDATTSMSDMAGATESLNKQYENWESMVEAVKRKSLTSITPIGDSILNLANNIIPMLFKALESDTFKNFVDDVTSGIGKIGELISGGLGDGGFDLGTVIGNMLGNVLARKDKIITLGLDILNGLIEGITSALPQLLPAALTILQKLVDFITESLPTLITAATVMLTSLVQGIAQALPVLIPAAVDMLLTLVDAILENLPLLVETALQLIVSLATGIAESLPELVPTIVEVVLKIVEVLLENLPLIIEAALALIMALTEGLIAAIPVLIPAIPRIVMAISDAIFKSLPIIGRAAGEIIAKLAASIIANLPLIIDSAWQLINTLYNTLSPAALANMLGEIGRGIVDGVWQGIQDAKSWFTGQLKDFFGGLVDSVKSALGIGSPSKLFADEVGRFIPAGVGLGIEKALPGLQRQLSGAMQSLSRDVNFGFSPNVSALTLRQAQGGAPFAGGTVFEKGSIVIHTGGTANPHMVGRAVQNGVLKALRAKGGA